MDSPLGSISHPQPAARSPMGHNYRDIRTQGGTVHMGDNYNFHDDPLSRLDYSKNARFNSKYRERASICQKNTRTDLLRDIYNWVDGKDERHIFWLSGLAGTGKSTIAQAVATHYYDRQKRVAASFFFARGGGDASHADLFVTSIAVQVANDIPLLRDAICKAITNCSDITTRSLTDQWRQLVLQPFSSLEVTQSPSSYLIVIDALDECASTDDIQIIIQLLSEARYLKSVRLKFFLTSRPEKGIHRAFGRVSEEAYQDVLLHEIEPGVVDQDISLFLSRELKTIAEDEGIGPDWPSSEQIKRLVRKSSSLFIWAATAARFIREGHGYAEKRLSTILATETTGSAPEKELDAIYNTVLASSIPAAFSEQEKGEYYHSLKSILGIVVVLLSPLSIQALSSLLRISVQEINRIVGNLGAILHIPKEQNSELRLHHPSFRDFLVDGTRCNDNRLQVYEKQAHRLLLSNCLLLMSATLKENICDLDYSNPGILRAKVEEKRIQQYIHPALHYACLYWVQHLQKSDIMIYDRDQVDNFMRRHLLAWLEALIWMGRAAESIQAVTCLQSIASINTCPVFCQYIQDVKRFISQSFSIVERAPLQLYLSALIFTLDSSPVRSNFQQRVFRWMKTLTVMEKNWSSLLQILEGHSDSVRALAFSPDGTILASASYDRTVWLWDTATGSARQTLEGHSDSVTALAFSPDGTILASNRGRIKLNSDDIISHSPPKHSTPAPVLVIENPWIACNGYNVLWLPLEYRSNVSALYTRKVAIGCQSGQVLLFELNDF